MISDKLPRNDKKMSGSDFNKIVVRRRAYEEPDAIHLYIYATNGSFSGATDLYCNLDQLKEIGEALLAFTKKLGNVYTYKYGSDKPEDKYYRYFLFTVKDLTISGNCQIYFEINLNLERKFYLKEKFEELSKFSILSHINSLEKLGRLFLEFYKLEHAEFHWSNNSQTLFEYHQEETDSLFFTVDSY